MSWPQFETDGETWQVRIDAYDPHPGVHALVFSCLSNPQRPYHVVEVPAEQLPNEDALDRLPDDRLAQLFAHSDPMDFPHEAIDPDHPHANPLPPPPPGVDAT